MKQYLLIIGFLLSISLFGQSQLTQEQIEKRNYKEVIGALNPIDSLKPDKFAMYPNGIEGLQKSIAKNMKYPKQALKNRTQGKVVLKFIVEKDGSIKEIEVVQSVDPDLDAESIRNLKSLEPWIPGYKNGLPIRIAYRFPFTYRLE